VVRLSQFRPPAGTTATAGEIAVPDLNLQPGELYLARSPAILRTILGSCVGVTFWSQRLGAGALCHRVLPRHPSVWHANFDRADCHRYVDSSIRYLAMEFDKLGARREEIVVKVFGGTDVLAVTPGCTRVTVGAQNCAVALDVLPDEGFVITASDIGGRRGRRIQFDTSTGRCCCTASCIEERPRVNRTSRLPVPPGAKHALGAFRQIDAEPFGRFVGVTFAVCLDWSVACAEKITRWFLAAFCFAVNTLWV
jgi:chemotaxis protein CheD